MAKAKESVSELNIVKVDRGRLTVCLIGTTPIIFNRQSEKVKHELLLPKGKKTAADKAANLKHDPYQEFVDSPYINGPFTCGTRHVDPRCTSDEECPTLIVCLAAAFKGALKNAALDVPGSTKAAIGRLCWVEGERLPVWGIPQMLMSDVRCQDQNHTPDIRTRVIIPRWACRIMISFMKPMLNEQNVMNLLVAAGMMQGIGDWRNGKGSGTYGSFMPANEDDPEFKAILKEGGRKAQEKAMVSPEYYNDETRELYEWYLAEVKKRGREDQTSIGGKRHERNGKKELVGVKD